MAVPFSGTASLIDGLVDSPNGLAGAPLVLRISYRVTLPLLSNVLRLGFDATMKALLLALCLAASYGVALANESRHSVIVDMPEVITLTHASPNTWHTLLPVQPNEGPTSYADARTGHALSHFAQQHRHGLGTELAF
jgi:hypothetical protein